SYTALTINNSGDTSSHSVTLSSTGLTGLAPAAINWVANDLRSLTIRAGNGLNTITVLDTPQSSVAGGLLTQLFCGTSLDTVNVRATTGALTIDGGGGLDSVTVGNAGSVQAVRGTPPVSTPPRGGYTDLTIDNTAVAPASQNIPLGATGITGLAPAAINYAQGDLRALNVSIGGSNSFVTIPGTPSSGFA